MKQSVDDLFYGQFGELQVGNRRYVTDDGLMMLRKSLGGSPPPAAAPVEVAPPPAESPEVEMPQAKPKPK